MIDEISIQEQDRILSILREHNGSYLHAAKHALVSANTIKQIDIVRNKKYGYTPEGRGPKHMQKHIVATTLSHTAWDNSDPKIQKARDLVDEGKATMCTGRDGLNLILYCIPLKQPIKNKKPYFSAVEEEDE